MPSPQKPQVLRSCTLCYKFTNSIKRRLLSAARRIQKMDSIQESLLQEKCILVDENDVILGGETKKNCHLKTNIKGPQRMLHRAFSVFIFSHDANRMLLQQRAQSKITYPGLWTNACCSHPLFEIEGETQGWLGVKRAAIRRLDYELGFGTTLFKLEDFTPVARIHYEAENTAEQNNIFMEHEIDYLLFLQKEESAVNLGSVNKNEVMATKWVDQNELTQLLLSQSESFTPWFKIISQHMLFPWWLQLKNGNFCKLNENDQILRYV